MSRDLYNNIKVSEPTQVSIKTISGLRPSVDITYPTAAIDTGNESDSALYEAIGISSEIPIFIDAIDEDGNPLDPADLAEVNVYANNQLIGPAKRVGQESLKYYFDIQDLGLNAGRYMFNVGAIDYLGNYARSSNVPIEIVTTKQRPPEISVLNPFAKSDNLSIGNTVHFLVQVREKDRPIRLVEFLVDGEVVSTSDVPVASIGDLHFFEGSFTPTSSKNFLYSAVVTDLSGIKATATGTVDNTTDGDGISINFEQKNTKGIPILITNKSKMDLILNNQPVNGVNYSLVNFVGNRKSTPTSFIPVSSTFGANMAPTASLVIPEAVSYVRAPESVKLMVSAEDLDGHSSSLSCQFLVNGSNEIIQFLSSPQEGDSITFLPDGAPKVEYFFGFGDITIEEDIEDTVKNLYDQISSDIEAGNLPGVEFVFMPDNFYENDTEKALSTSIYLRTDRSLPPAVSSSADRVFVNSVPYVSSSDSGTFIDTWTPTMGGAFALSAIVKDASGGSVVTNTSILIAEQIIDSSLGYLDPDFNGSLIIYPEAALTNPVALGSTLSVRADYTGIFGEPFDHRIDYVQFRYNGEEIGPQQTEGPFSALVELNDDESTWRIEAYAKPLDSTILPLIISAEGQTIASIRKPELTLFPPSPLSDRRSTGNIASFPDGMELSVQMLAEGEDSVLREIESAEFFINGKPIVGSYREAPRLNSSGLYTAITYTVDFILDYYEYAKPDGSLVMSAMVHMSNMVSPTMAKINGGDVNEFTIKIEVPENNNYSTASLFYDLTGQSIGRQQYQEYLDSGKTQGEWIAETTTLPSITQMVDVVAARHVTVGEYFDSYADFKSDLDAYRQENVTDATLMSYIDMLLSSSDYFAANMEVPQLVGTYSQRKYQNFGQNRESFARQCITNKSGQASYSQLYQASIRMLNYWRTTDSSYWEFTGRGTESTSASGQRLDARTYQNGDIAVDFIFNLAKERLILGSDPYLYGLNPMRTAEYLAASYMYSIWKDMGDYPLDRSKVSSYGSLSNAEMFQAVLNDRRHKQRHNRLWRYSKKVENAEGWKQEDWFGYFNDYNYPWIYHSKLGWLYTSGASQKNFWAHNDKLGWLWVSTSAYPHVFSAADGAWIYFDTEGPQNSNSRAKSNSGVYYYSYKYRGWSKL